MHNETLLPTSWRARPRGFVALMSLYESNYLRLVSLCGNPAGLRGKRLSRVSGSCDLQLQVLESAAYTTTLSLTHLFDPSDGGPLPQALQTYPDVRVRVYCDARLAQAQHWRDEPKAAVAGSTAAERELHQRWSQNIMLNKWLEYCLDLGHSLTCSQLMTNY
jgi:uncharacterized protein